MVNEIRSARGAQKKSTAVSDIDSIELDRYLIMMSSIRILLVCDIDIRYCILEAMQSPRGRGSAFPEPATRFVRHARPAETGRSSQSTQLESERGGRLFCTRASFYAHGALSPFLIPERVPHGFTPRP